MTSWRSFLSPWLHGHLVPWRPISLRTSGPVLGMVTVGIVFERRFLAKELFEDFLDLANVLLIFSSFHSFASISAWVFFIQELQQEVPTRHFGSVFNLQLCLGVGSWEASLQSYQQHPGALYDV